MQGTDQPTPPNSPAHHATPTDALYWAAVAVGLTAAQQSHGHPLTPDDRAAYDRYQAAAHAHGYTDQDIRNHAATLSRPVTP